MEWFVERSGSREGPYQAGEIAARVAAGTLPADTPLVSTSGELHLTAGALIAASPSSSPASPSPSSLLIPPPPEPRRPVAVPLDLLRQWLSAVTAVEWAIAGGLLAGHVLVVLPVPVMLAASLLWAASVIAIIDIAWHRWGRLRLARIPLSTMERWSSSTWIASILVGWVLIAWVIDLFVAGVPWWLATSPYTIVYLVTRRRLVAALVQAERSGSYASAKDLGDAQRGVAGAPWATTTAQRNRHDRILHGCGFAVSIAMLGLVFISPQIGSNHTRAIREVIIALQDIYEQAPHSDEMAMYEAIDVSRCPADFRGAYTAYLVAIKHCDRMTAARAAITSGDVAPENREAALLFNAAIVAKAEKDVEAAAQEMLRVARTYGVELE